MKKFWKWATNEAPVPDDTGQPAAARKLYLNGVIAEESWFDDEVTSALFQSELDAGDGDVTVYINSPGGDCFAAARIYNMLRDYRGKVTVQVDAIAASAASVIAMAGDTVLVSPVSMIMVHNPATIAMGDHCEMEKALAMLDEVKNTIINAYQTKTGLSRQKLSQLMEDETWMDARRAVELRFADAIIERERSMQPEAEAADSVLFARKPFVRQVTNLVNARFRREDAAPTETRNAADLYDRLKDIKYQFLGGFRYDYSGTLRQARLRLGGCKAVSRHPPHGERHPVRRGRLRLRSHGS